MLVCESSTEMDPNIYLLSGINIDQNSSVVQHSTIYTKGKVY